MHVPDGRCGASDGVVPSLAGDRGSVYFLERKRKNALLDVCHGIEVTIECHGCFAEFLGYFSYGELVDAFAIGYFEPFGQNRGLRKRIACGRVGFVRHEILGSRWGSSHFAAKHMLSALPHVG